MKLRCRRGSIIAPHNCTQTINPSGLISVPYPSMLLWILRIARSLHPRPISSPQPASAVIIPASPSALPLEIILRIIEDAASDSVQEAPIWAASLRLVCRATQQAVQDVLYPFACITHSNQYYEVSRVRSSAFADSRTLMFQDQIAPEAVLDIVKAFQDRVEYFIADRNTFRSIFDTPRPCIRPKAVRITDPFFERLDDWGSMAASFASVSHLHILVPEASLQGNWAGCIAQLLVKEVILDGHARARNALSIFMAVVSAFRRVPTLSCLLCRTWQMDAKASSLVEDRLQRLRDDRIFLDSRSMQAASEEELKTVLKVEARLEDELYWTGKVLYDPSPVRNRCQLGYCAPV
ncbi:hypothetical protein EXIGLDRAFT_724595 [Exidia glandulosa HHB12029]|uniref:F-box domain-containing protein n=1 Tax=Exidia glandulosa HHB12029 TaxID=1314781 RepID=A0A166BB43_EXIGL|nr:hypothetical protein EXIGLDRAFT_724595 [Exidia glandulosa HHB12029]